MRANETEVSGPAYGGDADTCGVACVRAGEQLEQFFDQGHRMQEPATRVAGVACPARPEARPAAHGLRRTEAPVRGLNRFTQVASAVVRT